MVEPVLSVASISTSTTSSASLEGVPESVLVPPSIDNQAGPLFREYVIDVSEVKVDGESVKAKGLSTHATGGTCELSGR